MMMFCSVMNVERISVLSVGCVLIIEGHTVRISMVLAVLFPRRYANRISVISVSCVWCKNIDDVSRLFYFH